MSTAGIVQHRDALRPCCPDCDSLNVKIYKRGTGHCQSCQANWPKPNYRVPLTHRGKAKPPPEKPKKAGSGVFPEPVRERPMRPLEYDMMSHMRLAMVGRR